MEESCISDSVSTPLKRKHSDETKSYKEWSPKATKILIHLYKEYRNRVGLYEMRNLKMMFDKISNVMRDDYNLEYSSANCSNRWKVLERRYKDFIDDQKKTGRGKKYFEYLDEMTDIFGNKKNIYPKLLLTANSQSRSSSTAGAERENTDITGIENNNDSQNAQTTDEVTEITFKKAEKKVTPLKQLSPNTKWRKSNKKYDTLMELNKQKKEYYHQKTLYLQNMLEEKKAYHKEKLLLEKEKIAAIKKQNILLTRLIHKTSK